MEINSTRKLIDEISNSIQDMTKHKQEYEDKAQIGILLDALDICLREIRRLDQEIKELKQALREKEIEILKLKGIL